MYSGKSSNLFFCCYCKSGNIRCALILREFSAKLSKHGFKNPRKYLQYFVYTFWIQDLCIDHVCWCKWVNILEHVWGLLYFCAAQQGLYIYVSLNDVNFDMCSTKMTSEHRLSTNLTTCKYVFVLPNAKT